MSRCELTENGLGWAVRADLGRGWGCLCGIEGCLLEMSVSEWQRKVAEMLSQDGVLGAEAA